MIGNILTGLSEKEEIVIELDCDTTGNAKTKFHICNCPAGVDMEIGRLSIQLERAEYPRHVAIDYGWLSYGLVRAENWKKPGDTFEFPRTEKGKYKDGSGYTRIPIEWLIKHFGKAVEIRSELADAIFNYNHLTSGERKNWIWPLNSTISEDKTDSPVSAPKISGDTTKNVENAENHATSESIPDGGQKSPLL